ncbi:MAG: ATP-binding protein [Chloroherpetonaceae bacterium]
MQNYDFILTLIENDIGSLEEFFDILPIGVYLTCPEGRILLINDYIVKILQLPSKDYLKGYNINEQGSFPNIVSREKFVGALESQGHLENIVNQYTTISGTIIYVNENSTAIPDKNGKIKFFIGTMEDITEKVSLASDENYIHKFMNIVNDALIHLVENPYMISSIEYSFQLIGKFLNFRTIKALFLKQFDKFSDFNDFECVVDWYNDNYEIQKDDSSIKEIFENFPDIIENLMIGNNYFFDNESSNELQKYILSKSNISTFLCTPIIYSNQFAGLIFFGNQETNRKWDDSTLKLLGIIGNAIGSQWNNFRNQKEIEQLKNKLERIVEASHLGIWEYNVNQDAFVVNSFFKELVNLPIDESNINRDTVQQLITIEDQNKVDQNIEDLLSGKMNSLNVDFRINTTPLKYLQIKGKIIQWSQDGKPQQVSGILLDITELKALHNQLQETIRVKDKFFDIIAHDLKNPMNAVKSLLDDLLTNFHLFSSDELFEAQAQIHKSISILAQLVNNLLEWSRTQTGHTMLNPDFIDISYVINNAIDVNFLQAETKGIELINNVANNTIVFADSNMLYTIFRNLISNAIKYTQNNGKITITSKDLVDYYEFSVSDTGIGMSAEQLHNLFSLEHIQSVPGTNQEKGTGLGLIISKEFVERNGGKITVQSQLNQGSTFSFTIPKSLKE